MRALAYFDRFAANLDRLAWSPRSAPWAEWAWRTVAEELGPTEGCLIVDLGTGTGAAIENMLRFAPRARFLGVDFSPEMIRRARDKGLEQRADAQVELRLSRIDELRLPPGSVDRFVSSGTFHHVKNKARVFANLYAMLRPGGRFINVDHFRVCGRYQVEVAALRARLPEEAAETDRVRAAFQWIYDQDRDHPIEFHTDPYEFQGLLEQAGFVEVRVLASLLPGYAVVSARKPAG